MPAFRFDGLVPVVYPETRDEHGVPLQLVEPGDERDLDQAPDFMWTPVEDGRPAAKSRARTAAGGTAGPQETGAASGPGSDEAGQPGSEEG